MRRTHPTVSLVLAACLCASGAAAEEPAASDASSGPAAVVTAGFIGSPGTEWFTAGAFLPDGTILLCGITADPELTLGGVKAEPLGTDAPPLPAPTAWRRLSQVETGKVAAPKLAETGLPGATDSGADDDGLTLQTDDDIARIRRKKDDEARETAATPGHLRWSKDDTVETATVFRKLAWSDPEATGFLGVFSSDLKKALALRRLPRGAGSITGAGLAPDGSLYIAGGASERIRGASANVRHVPEVTPTKTLPVSMFPLIYAAKLSPDLSRVLWVRTAPAEMYGPRLRALRDGSVAIAGPDVRVFSPDGDLQRANAISRSRNPDTVTVNPVTGWYAKGGDFLGMTGREPYRSPYIFIFRPDGALELELFRWRAAFAGLDSLRLVADAQVERMVHDDDGNLVVFSRSHGGNCVQIRYPYDIDRFMPNGLKALPMNSPGCVMKLGPDYNVRAAGVWSDPGFVKSVGHGADGSVAWTGLAKAGMQAFVASPRLDARRFVSPLPACGRRIVSAATSEDFAIATGRLAGRPMLMFLSGAVAGEEGGGAMLKPPMTNPVQPAFAGGLLDGHVILLDLSPTAVPAEPAAEPAPPTAAPAPRAGPKRIVRDDPPLMPAQGQTFALGIESYFNVQLTVRDDPESARWPRFLHGRAEKGGTFTVSTNGPSEAAFTLRLTNLEQADGAQDRRVLGTNLRYRVEQTADASGKAVQSNVLSPAIFLEVTGMSPWRMRETRHESAETIRVDLRPVCSVGGRIHVGERIVAVTNAPCSGSFAVPRGVDPREPGVRPNVAFLKIEFPLAAGDLGLTPPMAADRLRFRFACTGHAQVKYAALEKIVPPKLGVPEMEGVVD